MAHYLWSVGLSDWSCITLTVKGSKTDRIHFFSPFSVSSHFLSVCISFPLLFTMKKMQKVISTRREDQGIFLFSLNHLVDDSHI